MKILGWEVRAAALGGARRGPCARAAECGLGVHAHCGAWCMRRDPCVLQGCASLCFEASRVSCGWGRDS